jgi:branched-chain amino acid transport system substrate-binding protein
VQSGVVAVLVGQESDPGDIAKIAVGAGIPYVVMTGNSAQELTLKGSFSLTAGNGGGIGAMAGYAKDNGYKKVAALTIDSPAGIAVVKTLGALAFKNAGVGLQVIPVPQSVTDMTPQVQAAISGGSDALFVIGATTFCTAFFQAVASIAPTIPRMSTPACDTPNAIATSPPAAVAGTAIPLPFQLDSSEPSVAAFKAAVQHYSNDAALAKDAEAATGYATVVGLVGILKSTLPAGEVTAASILAALPKTSGVPLPLAPGVTMTCDGKVIGVFPSVCSAGFFIYKLTSGGGTQFVTSVKAAPLFAS